MPVPTHPFSPRLLLDLDLRLKKTKWSKKRSNAQHLGTEWGDLARLNKFQQATKNTFDEGEGQK